MLFNIFLFIAFFCFYCCLIPKQTGEKQDSFENFIPSIKEAFSSDFDPISDTIEKSTNPQKNHCLSPSQTQLCHKNEPITDSIPIVPFTTNYSSNLPANPESLTYQELKDFIKVHNLQAMVKNICGKSDNRCKKKELIQALKG